MSDEVFIKKKEPIDFECVPQTSKRTLREHFFYESLGHSAYIRLFRFLYILL